MNAQLETPFKHILPVDLYRKKDRFLCQLLLMNNSDIISEPSQLGLKSPTYLGRS